MTPPVKPTPPYVHYGRIIVEPEANFDPSSFKTLVGGDYRIVIGCPKGEYEPSATWVDEKGKTQKGKCRVSRRVHSVLAPTGRTVTFSSPDRITEDEPGQFTGLYERTPSQVALGEAIRKRRLPPVGEMGMEADEDTEYARDLLSQIRIEEDLKAPKLEQSRIRELNDIMNDMLDFIPPEAIHLSRSVFEKDVRKALGPDFTEEEIDYIIVHLRARLMAEAKGKGRAMASPNGEMQELYENGERQEFLEDKWANIAIKHGVKLTIDDIESEPWRVVTFREAKTSKWFSLPYDDIYEAEDPEGLVEDISKKFESEWETRVGQHLDETPMEAPVEEYQSPGHYPKKFEDWYAENRDSSYLQEEYSEACFDARSVGEKPITKKQFWYNTWRQLGEQSDWDAPLSDKSKKWLKYGAITGGVVIGGLVTVALVVQYMYLKTAENIATAFAQAGRK